MKALERTYRSHRQLPYIMICDAFHNMGRQYLELLDLFAHGEGSADGDGEEEGVS